jgi:beta-N-acetylhexosaminidase
MFTSGQTAAGVMVPDTRPGRDGTELVRSGRIPVTGASGSRRRLFYPAVAGVLALGLLAACSSSGPVKGQRPKPSPTGSAAGAVTAMPKLSLAQMAGQRVIYSYSGLTPPASLLSWIRQGEAGGVIFFSQNISSEAQIASVIAELGNANASPQNPLRKSPLLLMTDQEGGLVRRLPGAPVLSEKQIGESADPAAQATEAGTGAGENLARAGMNVNLAPVLDVYRAPGDFDDQFQRSYSMNPQTVSGLGADFIQAQQATGVAAAAKHFPGLGTATSAQNTDQRPVTLPVSLQALRAIDEYPYRAAIAGGVKLVLVSWAIYPALDPIRPAGLSPAVVGGELRQRLGFTGVTITDALEAGALQPFGTAGHRATLAAQAGMDLILCSAQQVTEGEQARSALENGYKGGTLGQAAFQVSLQRILALKSSLAR